LEVTGHYAEADTVIHRLDPRTKMLLMLSAIISAFMFNNPLFTFSVFLVGFFLFVLSGLLKFWKYFLTISAPVALFSVVVWSFFFQDHAIFTIQLVVTQLTVTWVGIQYGMAAGLRLTTVILASAVFIGTTSPEDISLVLTKLKFPQVVGFLFTSTILTIDTLIIDARTILDVMRTRGIEIDKGGIVHRTRAAVRLIVPLLFASMKRVNDLSIVLVERAYNPRGKRTFVRTTSFRSKDYVVIGLIGLFLAVCLSLRLMGYGVLVSNKI
jgi:energy-coupling factor transport system permease protein